MKGGGKETWSNCNPSKSRHKHVRHATLEQHLRKHPTHLLKWPAAAPACYGNMLLMFANMVSSGLCVAIHQPQTHLCNLGGNLSERRWAAESPPHCLAGPDEKSKHSGVSERYRISQTNTSGLV